MHEGGVCSKTSTTSPKQAPAPAATPPIKRPPADSTFVGLFGDPIMKEDQSKKKKAIKVLYLVQMSIIKKKNACNFLMGCEGKEPPLLTLFLEKHFVWLAILDEI